MYTVYENAIYRDLDYSPISNLVGPVVRELF
jgi:hypothetical protein